MDRISSPMARALEIAYDRFGLTSPNPAVGAVVVRDGRIIGEGGTGPYGSSHAEVAALASCGDASAGSDMYVTLEPCCHFGKTPPCTDAVIRAGIRRVFIALLDPNPLVAGKGVARLKDAGVETVLLREYSGPASDLIRPFKKYILRGETFILNKAAMTLDGRTATRGGDSQWISSDLSRYVVHRLRAKLDAIIVGRNTFERDNPSLNVRLKSFGPAVEEYFRDGLVPLNGEDNYFLGSLLGRDIGEYTDPLRVLVGLPTGIDFRAPFFADDHYLVFERADALERKLREHPALGEALRRLNLVTLTCEGGAGEAREIAKELARRGIMTAMLEGGSCIAGSFFDAGQIDQFLYIIAPKLAGNGLPVLEGGGIALMSEAMRLRQVSAAFLEGDMLFSGYRESYNFEMM